MANTAMEREERALHLMEREVADREARVASRERMLVEREAKVGTNRREVRGETYVP